jgi:glycosyltransferase involved in cell wall biosynthesis
MEKEMKIYLQYPWKFPDSPYYKYLIDSLPKNIEFINTKKQKGVITSKTKFWISNFLKKIIRKSVSLLHLSIPNAHLTRTNQKYDLIHCAHCLSLNKQKNWITDFESLWQVGVSWKKTKLNKKLVNKILLRNNCKKILTWTNKTKEDFIREFPEIKNKVEVMYPAIPFTKFKDEKSKNIKIIFSGRYFYHKGGLHSLEAMDRLTKKYSNVEGIINSEVPKKIMKKYSKNKKLKFYGLIPQKTLFELYSKSDIFLYPGYSDSFGFAYLEAMNFGLPIVTIDGYARKEIIQDKKNGFIIEKPKYLEVDKISKNEEKLIKKLINKVSLLIENKNLRNRISKNNRKVIEKGKFSIQERNKKLNRVYREAIK